MSNQCDHKFADKCHDQAPIFMKAARGIRGNSYIVEVTDDELAENMTYITAKEYDEITKTYTEKWRSDNINGGRLQCFYHLNKQNEPKTFTLTFVYTRPKTPGKADAHERTRWAFTTPAIPYMFEGDTPMMGSIVGTIFLKDHKFSSGGSAENDKYKEMLTYPIVPGEDIRDNFNAPYPPGGKNKISGTTRQGDTPESSGTHMPNGTEWNVYMDLTEFDEFVKVVGISRTKMINIINDIADQFTPSAGTSNFNKDFRGVEGSTLPTIASDNIKEYIDDMMKRENLLRHNADNDLQEQIDAANERIRKLEQYVAALTDAYDDVFQSLLDKIYGPTDTVHGKGGTISTTYEPIPSGSETPTQIPVKSISFNFNNDDKIPVGNMNILSEQSRNSNKKKRNSKSTNGVTNAPVYLRTHKNDSNGDYKVK